MTNDLLDENTEIGKQIKNFSEYAKNSLKEDPNFMPMMHCMSEKGLIIIACPWENEEAKIQFMTQLAPMMLAYHKVKSFIFASQVWVKKCKTDEEAAKQKGKSLEGDPEATDALMCMYVSDDHVLQNLMHVKLAKDDDGKVLDAIVEDGEWKEVGDFEGRVVDMLKKSREIHPTMAKMYMKLKEKKGDESVFTKEDREEITEYIGQMAEEGKLPQGIVESMIQLNKNIDSEPEERILH